MIESVNWQSVCKNVMTIDKEAEVLKMLLYLYIINCFVYYTVVQFTIVFYIHKRKCLQICMFFIFIFLFWSPEALLRFLWFLKNSFLVYISNRGHFQARDYFHAPP